LCWFAVQSDCCDLSCLCMFWCWWTSLSSLNLLLNDWFVKHNVPYEISRDLCSK
jgi:hypothetical protein